MNLTQQELDTLIHLLEREVKRSAKFRENRAARGKVFTPAPGHVDVSKVREARLQALATKLSTQMSVWKDAE